MRLHTSSPPHSSCAKLDLLQFKSFFYTLLLLLCSFFLAASAEIYFSAQLLLQNDDIFTNHFVSFIVIVFLLSFSYSVKLVIQVFQANGAQAALKTFLQQRHKQKYQNKIS